jgi:hypothetical protein
VKVNTGSSRSWLRLVWVVALAAQLALAATGKVSAAGSIYYVKASAGGSNNGTSWTDAYTDLQSALGPASSGDQIWVAAGTYKPGTLRTDTFSLKTGVAIYGGFAGTETLLSQRNPAVNVTTLSGDIGTSGDATDNSYHVVSASGVDGTAILDGFTVSGGNADGTYPADSGGGMWNDSGSPSLTNVILSGNAASHNGGGIFNNGGNLTLTKVLFNGNTSGSEGGGIKGVGGSPTLTDVTFTGNTAAGAGGGMLTINGTTPHLTNVTFSGNSAGTGVGGGLHNYGTDSVLVNVTFGGNSADSGAGMWNTSSNPSLTNVTFSGNTAAASGGGMYNWFSNPTITNSILYGDTGGEIFNSTATPVVTYSDVQGGYAGTGNISANPKLGALVSNGGFTKTMALGAGSAALDAADTATCAAKDQRGVARPQGGKCDMGAYEVKALTFQSVGANDGWVLESGEATSVGGSMNSASTTFRLGDDAANRQYRSLLSFNTAGLPDVATIVLARVKVKRQGLTGTSPFTTHGTLTLDLKKPFFGAALGLELGDFQAAATKNSAGSIASTLVSGWYSGLVNAASLGFVNKTGPTQLRLRFSLDDNNDHGADYLSVFSGNAPAAARPVLLVYYNP